MCAWVSPVPAWAGDEQTEGRRPYLRLYTGVGLTGDSDLRVHQPSQRTDLTFERVSWEHKSLSTNWTRDSIPYMGARAGVFLKRPRWLSVSVEVLHFKVFAKTEKSVHVRGTDQGRPVDGVASVERFVQAYQVSNGVNMILSNLQVHRRLGKNAGYPGGRADLYGGLGAGVTIPFTRSTIDGESQGQYEWGGLATQMLGGVVWHVSRRFDISLEYKFTLTTVNGQVAHGDSRSRLRTHHLVFGVGYVL